MGNALGATALTPSELNGIERLPFVSIDKELREFAKFLDDPETRERSIR